MSKDTFYFSHDYNARSDEKIKKLLKKHGMKGYGIFWSLIENLYNNENIMRTDYKGIAYDLRTNEIIIESIINDFDLFQIDTKNSFFGSNSIGKRLDERNKKSESARQSVFQRWNKNKNTSQIPDENDTNVYTNVSNSDTNVSKNDTI